MGLNRFYTGYEVVIGIVTALSGGSSGTRCHRHREDISSQSWGGSGLDGKERDGGADDERRGSRGHAAGNIPSPDLFSFFYIGAPQSMDTRDLPRVTLGYLGLPAVFTRPLGHLKNQQRPNENKGC